MPFIAYILNTALADSQIVSPYEIESKYAADNNIDTLVMTVLNEHKIEPANLCSDEVFIRRLYLDVIGTLPEPNYISLFLADSRPDKRTALIEKLIVRKEFAEYWSLKWCDILRVKAEYPINLWPNAAQAYHRWIYDCLKENLPYDQFALQLLTSSGSNFRVPAINFYRAIQGHTPSAIASAVALSFMGTRIDKWPQERRTNMEAFFSRVAYKKTDEWKEEIVFLNPAPTGLLKTAFPDGVSVQIPDDQDPRKVFADWLINPKNQWFSRNIVNRIWAWLLCRGIIHEPDDIRPDNPAVNQRLLDYLEGELVKANYDMRHIYRLILNSHTYQQSSIPRSDEPNAGSLFAYYSVQRLDAEVIIDALCWIFGSSESYSSLIPEPYTFIPDENRTIDLADGSITSQFLEMFGRPARDTGLVFERNNQISDTQSLHLLNSTHIQRMINNSKRLQELVTRSKGDRTMLVNNIYLVIMSRYPTKVELAEAIKYFQTSGLGNRVALNDIAWSLINTKEFLYRH